MQKCDLLYLNLKEYCELYGQLSQSASLFPCVQKCIWHQPTGLSCKAFCTIKIGLILRYTPFVFPTYNNTPFVRPNTFGQMGCCSFREKVRIFYFNGSPPVRHSYGLGTAGEATAHWADCLRRCAGPYGLRLLIFP